MLGISIGRENRDRFFSRRNARIQLIIDKHMCLVELVDNFWTTCPEIRVAKDEVGTNYLESWIIEHGLLPPGASVKLRGKPDKVLLEVVIPEERFRVLIPHGSGRG